ncbi:MAG: transporter substrate-binding domain-containing protein [Methanoregulaceae archaeon]|jgi:polar amino acid transport system substrate-binding protein|nr:transporter substrate-binding domain-containing protein [Methanoregulaceae archaeon]MCC7469505.1 transporter substrate-binding domain-containing protein [Burkholderiaceae bacterium]NLH26718.1 transporter substrate-binding domain-containing protein [Methanomicrobiales archaeon]HPA08872.1 transporter substrate-binding domain-containing protein [Methanoregulaceae archaeon]HPS22085.1 transporter substrate-binding domain-containing protein [Methanoregulaceae archaeon]
MPVPHRLLVLSILALLLGTLLVAGCLTEQPAAETPAAVRMSDLTIYTEQVPPYNYLENGTTQGISVDLFELITEKMGERVLRDEVKVVPWSEGYTAALTGNRTLIFAIARIPEREHSFKWAGPIIPITPVLFALPERGIVIGSPEDLEGYRIGAVSENAEIQQLLSLGVNRSQLVLAPNASVLITMLQDGEIDLMAYSQAAGRFFARQVTGSYDTFRVVYVFQDVPLYYAFSRDVPDETVQSFQDALDTLKTAKEEHGYSEYERILYQHVGVSCQPPSLAPSDVTNLVNVTAAAIERDAPDTIRRINAGEAPYRDPEQPGLYVFVFDRNVTLVAQAVNPGQVGAHLHGKTDVTGTPFRDRIVSGALQNGSGWQEYVYMNPTDPGLYHKASYYRLVNGSDGTLYIVGSGMPKACEG